MVHIDSNLYIKDGPCYEEVYHYDPISLVKYGFLHGELGRISEGEDSGNLIT